MNNYITEIIPDLKNLPAWAREAFEDGQYFNVVDKKIKQVEELPCYFEWFWNSEDKKSTCVIENVKLCPVCRLNNEN